MCEQNWIDVSVALKSGMVHWPGDSEVAIYKKKSMERGDPGNLTHLDFCAHVGTHIDAPMHYIRDGIGIDAMPPEAMIGAARVIEITDQPVIKPEHLQRYDISQGDRIVLKTDNSAHCWNREDFVTDYVYISVAGAEYLVEKGVSLVGIDYLSVEKFNGEGKTHRTLLGAGIWLVEGLNLKSVPPGKCEMLCLPLRLVDTDGSPCRAFIKPL